MAFDFTTHQRDKKGRIIARNPYKRICNKHGVFLLRSNVYYYENGSAVPEDMLIRAGFKEAPKAAPVVATPAPAVAQPPKEEVVIAPKVEASMSPQGMKANKKEGK